MVACVLLNIQGLSKSFGGIVAVDQLNLEVYDNEIFGLIGPNGAGKSTLFKLISGFEQRDSGDVRISGQSVSGLQPHEICKRGIATTFQQPLHIRDLSVLEVLTIASYNHSVNFKAAADHSRKIASKFGLESRLTNKVRHLDFASLRKLDFARAVATGGKVILLDELFAGQDESDLKQLIGLVISLRADGITFFLADHVIEVLAQLCDRLAFMNAGTILKTGRPEDILADTKVREFYFGDR